MRRARARSVYCARAQWASIVERAAVAGMPVSRFVAACALSEPPVPGAQRPGGLFDHRLALSEGEQRMLHERIGALERCTGALLERLPGAEVSLLEALLLLGEEARAKDAPAPGKRLRAGAPLTRTGRAAAATHAISCTDDEWARIRACAARAGMSISAYVVERARGAALEPPGGRASAPRLVLEEAEQRVLLARVARIEARTLGAAAPGEGWLADLLGAVEVLLDRALLRLVCQDRSVREVLAERVGAERGARIAERFEQRRKARALLA